MATKKTGYIASHELHYNDEIEGPAKLAPGDEVPTGLYSPKQVEYLLSKGAIRKAKASDADVSEEGGKSPEPTVPSGDVTTPSLR